MCGVLLVLGILNLFLRSSILFDVNLYLGLFMFVGYVIVDTQMIVEKASCGDKDYVWHAAELFIDFVAIFVRILIILMKKEEKKESRK